MTRVHRPPLSRAETLLHQVPEGDRPVFEAYYQRRVQAALAEATAGSSAPADADLDAIEAAVIRALIVEAEGSDDPHGLGFVPHQEQGSRFVPPTTDPRHRSVHGPRGATPHQGARAADQLSRLSPAWRWLAVTAALLGATAFLVWPHAQRSAYPSAALRTTVPGGPSPGATPSTTGLATVTPTLPVPTATPLVDAAASAGLGARAPTTPTVLDVTRPNGSVTVLTIVPSTGEMGGTWQPRVAPGTAAWLQGTLVNTVLCLPTDVASVVTDTRRGQLLTLRLASGAARVYRVLRVRSVGRQQTDVLDQRRAGLTLVLCDTPASGSNMRLVIEAVDRPSVPEDADADDLPRLGTPVGLADLLRLTVQAVRVVTATADLPPGLREVAVTVQVENLQATPLRWQDLADQLALGGQMAEAVAAGSEGLGTPLEGHAQRAVSFRYRVPSTGGPAAWQLLAPTGERVAVRVEVPGPAPALPSARGSAVSVTLDPHSIRVLDTGGTTRLFLFALTVSQPTAPALPLDGTTLAVSDGGHALPLVTPLPATLPGGSHTYQLATQAPTGKLVLVQWGAHRWRVQLP